MCDQQQETMHHLMLECSIAKQIWLAVSRLTNIVEFQPRHKMNLLNNGAYVRMAPQPTARLTELNVFS